VRFEKVIRKTIKKRGNCECIATWGRPCHASPFPISLRRYAKFDVAEPIHCHSVFAADTLLYAVTLTLNICSVASVTWGHYCTKCERNRTICGRVIAISVFDVMTLNMFLSVELGSVIIFTIDREFVNSAKKIREF